MTSCHAFLLILHIWPSNCPVLPTSVKKISSKGTLTKNYSWLCSHIACWRNIIWVKTSTVVVFAASAVSVIVTQNLWGKMDPFFRIFSQHLCHRCWWTSQCAPCALGLRMEGGRERIDPATDVTRWPTIPPCVTFNSWIFYSIICTSEIHNPKDKKNNHS